MDILWVPNSLTFIVGQGRYRDTVWLVPPGPATEPDWSLSSPGWLSPIRAEEILEGIREAFPAAFEGEEGCDHGIDCQCWPED